MLDVLEPVGVLGAQVLYVLQPVAGVIGMRAAFSEIARALETPEGVEALRQQLED